MTGDYFVYTSFVKYSTIICIFLANKKEKGRRGEEDDPRRDAFRSCANRFTTLINVNWIVKIIQSYKIACYYTIIQIGAKMVHKCCRNYELKELRTGVGTGGRSEEKSYCP